MESFNPEDFAWRGLTMTPAAAEHIRALTSKQDGVLGVRLGIKQTGCAGFGYVLDTVTEPDNDDLLYESDGARLYVPLQAMPEWGPRNASTFLPFRAPPIQRHKTAGEASLAATSSSP